MILGPVTCGGNHRRAFLLAKMSLVLILVFLLQSTEAMHLNLHANETATNVYNKKLYLEELNKIQARFKEDLQAIKAKFVKINQELNNTNASSSSQVIKLQETLAEERDALYNIEKYLSLPFALKSCECLNFTDAQKKQLQNQIEVINKEIKELKQKLYKDNSTTPYSNPQCPNGECPIIKEIKRQIAQLQNYSKIMTETVTSECCKKITYLFRDNLAETSQWIYGNITEKEYRDNLTKRAEAGKMATCTASLPFVNISNNECFKCPTDKPIFDLGKRVCVEQCEKQSLILNTTTHQCTHNHTCQTGMVFNNKTKKCQADLGTTAVCPVNRPVWDDDSLSCQLCSSAHPFYDINVKSCRKCTENQIWDEGTRTCYNKANYHPVTCPSGFHYNTVAKHCQHDNGTIVNPTNNTSNNQTSQNATGTSGLCPPDTPYWDSADYVCAKCPVATPSFNETTKKCEACPTNTTWNYLSKTCVGQHHNCAANQFWNKTSQKCDTIASCGSNEVFNKETGKCQAEQQQTGQVGVCPPSTPFWNEQSLYCQKCPIKTPIWNETARKCESCPDKSVFDVATQKCKSNVTCPSGTVFNSTTGKCGTVSCPNDKPVFNSTKGECQACPSGTTYNFDLKTCQANDHQGKSSICPKDTPYWNSQRLSCQACPVGQTLNTSTKKCESVSTTSHFAAVSRHNLVAQSGHV